MNNATQNEEPVAQHRSTNPGSPADFTLSLPTPYELGHEAGSAGELFPLSAPAQQQQGWVCGNVERRARAGKVIAVICGGSRCLKCGEVNYGCRMGCSCWPEGGFDSERNQREGYRMAWGALVWTAEHVAKFMSSEELLDAQASGKVVVDHFTGGPLEVSA